MRARELAPEDAPIWVDYGRLALDAGRASEAKLAFQQATLRAESDNELRYWAKLRAPNLQLSIIAHDNLSVDCGSFLAPFEG